MLRLGLIRRGIHSRHVDLRHAKYRGKGTLPATLVRIVQQLRHAGRYDLPRHAVLVLQPTTRPLLATLGQPCPVVVDLILVGAIDQQRDGFAERETADLR